ncbi:hypothetical protein ACWEV4_02385 [Streptomyces sp. NPDC003860]
MTDLHDEHQDQEHEQQLDAADFDAFFGEQRRKRQKHRPTLTLYGRTYVLPESLPVLFSLEAQRVQHSADPEHVRLMLSVLYGDDVLDDWARRGLEDRELGILLLWSAAAVRAPGTVTLDRAAELYDEQAAGKAPTPNRAARRAKAKKKVRSSGRPS